jgi:cytochrome c oxidase subunit 2
MTLPDQHNHGEAASASAEKRWALAVGAIVAMLLAMLAYMILHWATMPPQRMETIDPGTLHLAGEFTEDNLGSTVEGDGSVTVRVLANQYAFTPNCIVVPSDTPVTIRATSADVIHGFSVTNTNVNLMLVPGYIATVKARFPAPADLLMPCHEFCGTGHAAMWAHVKVVDKAAFLARAKLSRRTNCVND